MKDELRIAVTGHRPNRIFGREQDIENWIRKELKRINCIEAYSGMAQGTDQIFAKIAEELGIPLICCYPYKRYSFHLEEEEINVKAKDVRFISDAYSKQSFWIRDKYMVDNCDLLFAVFDGVKNGGTWITVKYAEKIGKPIIYYDWRTE